MVLRQYNSQGEKDVWLIYVDDETHLTTVVKVAHLCQVYKEVLTWDTLVLHLLVVGLVGTTEPPVHLEVGARLFALTVSVDDRGEPAVRHCAISLFVPRTQIYLVWLPIALSCLFIVCCIWGITWDDLCGWPPQISGLGSLYSLVRPISLFHF